MKWYPNNLAKLKDHVSLYRRQKHIAVPHAMTNNLPFRKISLSYQINARDKRHVVFTPS